MSLPRPSRPVEETAPVAPVKKENKGFRPSDVFRFAPKPDITIDELAYLISVFWTLDVTHDRFDKFDESLQIHFDPFLVNK